MQLCDTDKGISCYSFLAAAIVQLIITIYFSILCVKAMQIYNLTSQKYPLITKIHLLKLITLFSIIGVEVAGLSLAFERSQSESIDASELFNSIVSIISEFICIFLLRKEFLVLKLTSGYLRSYISLSFFIYTVVLMVNAFNNKQNTFGLSPDQIVYILCLVLKFVLSAEVFIFKSDIIKSQKYEQDEYDYNYTQEELNENDDLYFHLQNQHMEIDTDKNVNKQSGCDFQIIYQEVVESRGSQVFHSKNHHTKQSFNQQNQFLNPQTFKGENSIKSNNQISQIRSTGKNNCQQDDIINPKYLNCKSQQNSQQKGSFQSSDQNLLQAMHNKSSITQNTNQKSFVQKYELEGRGNRSSQASNITETMQINHLFIKEIQNLNGTILIKIQITLMNGQEGELHKSLKEFQQIVTFIKNFFKQQDPDLIEIEQMNTNLKFHNTQDEEILMRKLEKIMNLIIINNFHTNSNISSFFKISDQIRSNSYNANCEEQIFSSYGNYCFSDEQNKTDMMISRGQKSFQENSKSQNQLTFENGLTAGSKITNIQEKQNCFSDYNHSNKHEQISENSSQQVSISIGSVRSSINDDSQELLNKESNTQDIIIKVKQIATEFIQKEDYTIKEQLPKVEIPELPFKEKTLDIFKSKTDSDIIDFRKKTLPSYFETILNNKQIRQLDFIKKTFFL